MSAQISGGKSPPESFRHMKDRDLAIWANVLCHQPPPAVSQNNSTWWTCYKSNTEKQVSALPNHLRAHPGPLQRLINKSQGEKSRAEARALCPLHDKLNRALARSTLGWIKAEIDVNIPAIIIPLFNTGLLAEDIRLYFEPLQATTAMWRSAKKFFEAWGKLVKPKWTYQEDHCAACVLARFASDVDVVAAFKAGLIARNLDEWRQGKPSKRLSYVNHLLSQFPDNKGANSKAEQIGRHVQKAHEQYKAYQRHAGRIEICFEPLLNPAHVIPSSSESNAEMPKPTPLQLGYPHVIATSKAREVLYSPSVYSPVQMKVHVEREGGRDVISQFIEAYRRTVWQPKLSEMEHSNVEAENLHERIAIANAMNWTDQDETRSTDVSNASTRTSEATVAEADASTLHSPVGTDFYSWKTSGSEANNTRDTQLSPQFSHFF